MSPIPASPAPRILIADDNAAIHRDFRKILAAPNAAGNRFDHLEKTLFGSANPPADLAAFRIDSAFQGADALALVQRAVRENDPYLLTFVDIRMPPGCDGIETLEQLWRACPELQAVLCTGHSEYSWDDIAGRFGQTDSLLILKKPFDPAEVLQVAHALTRKWALARQAQLRLKDLELMVSERTHNLEKEIEERARIQEALRISEERFSKAFQACPIPMSIQSHPEGRFLDANPSFLTLTGYPTGDLLHRTADELRLWGASPTQQLDALRSALPVRNQPGMLRRQDGTPRHTLISAEPITLQTGPCLLLIVEDVTDHVKLEANLRQAQKLEAVGCLAAGVAHEFNNLLTVIQGHTGLLRAKPLDNPTAAESVERIGQASERAASLTRRLLAFSHKQNLQLKPLNLSTIVQSVGQMLGQLIGERFQLSLDCAPSLPYTRADEANLEQVLINLTLNARDAMPDGGSLQIATSLVQLSDEDARGCLDARPGSFVCLSVADTGCGMTPEILRRIFDPFFTTKEVGKGTGLGLSTVHGIVKQHHGWIDVASRPGFGSTFKVFLPVWNGASAPQTLPGAAPDPNPRSSAGESVLIVEDEGIVREAARLALERAGYRVLEAADGPEAMAVWERSPVRVDLLVTDMVMPHGISGGTLARVLQSRDPSLRTLYTSGYSSEIIREDLHFIIGTHFLRKPYDTPALLNSVRQCLDSKAELTRS